jgi:hypothetical protein
MSAGSGSGDQNRRATRSSRPGSLPPKRGPLTASEVHRAVEYRPISRYEVTGGYLNLSRFIGGPDTFPTKEKTP